MDKRLLLVHAHPDDETINHGATMAKYLAEGARVTLVTCTAGEMGEVLVPELAHLAADQDDALGEHRRGELTAAMGHLGVTDFRFLGGFARFRDSGMKWHEKGYAVPADTIHDNAFWKSDLEVAANELVSVIREVRPQVMVTYDPFGGYGHPDHIQTHRVATYAVALAAVPTHRPDLGEAHDVAKVYWAAIPDAPVPEMVTPMEHMAARVDGSAHLQQVLDALACYPTQLNLDDFRQWITGVEWYRRAKGEPGPVAEDGLETDLFAGL